MGKIPYMFDYSGEVREGMRTLQMHLRSEEMTKFALDILNDPDFNMEWCDRCILGHLPDGYHNSLSRMFPTYSEYDLSVVSNHRGFSLPFHRLGKMVKLEENEGWNYLKDEWIRQLTKYLKQCGINCV